MMFGLFEGGEEIPQWYMQERSSQGQSSHDLHKRVHELEQQVAALTALVREMRMDRATDQPDLCQCAIKASLQPGNGDCVKCGKPILRAASSAPDVP
jgi:hypothetical protein